MPDNQEIIHSTTNTSDETIRSSSVPILLKRPASLSHSSDKRPHTPDPSTLRSSTPTQNQNEPSLTNELDEFILGLLKKPQERIFLLKLEQDLEAFINNYQLFRLDLPQMNSYQRLMVHKVAPYFKLSHFYDPVRRSVFLCKNQYTELPSIRFPDLVEQDLEKEEAPKFKIMRRSPLPHAHTSKRTVPQDKKPKTYEERKAAYEEARARIFCGMESQSSDKEDEEE
ncbi:R3H domain-containing protein 1 [Apophysomyces ossiformis]|uniref:R3H domain-containing protein 1 n=1 Tax=Apophysomyces ossiformis TaxID=679940 RepID=A0A8H7BWP2_9FUNG|nr:R3H domain-containing protein 1 [Apophysomyces ossiformis]